MKYSTRERQVRNVSFAKEHSQSRAEFQASCYVIHTDHLVGHYYTYLFGVCTCKRAHSCAQAHAQWYLWRSGDSLQDSVLSFFHTESQGSSSELRFGVMCLYLINRPVDPKIALFSSIIFTSH